MLNLICFISNNKPKKTFGAGIFIQQDESEIGTGYLST
jgi:hypothetical protein